MTFASCDDDKLQKSCKSVPFTLRYGHINVYKTSAKSSRELF